ncbi:UDP-2,3-diacylglucosamine diphosphatase [Planctobacterium marinum]|uniref:UDP-2,3-diacylglucosamine diphosphatase n=1 Tax=Planctobacterium marinum TaxID=1631968 RepID=UPI001E4CC348|nr:UDP-2,3-diacylglucosamine diphosphatase [Planctobacterium marinum]MCC2604541.1 UDP-2,3-diacylglucosamine diphosphatase [Planctobacterium marinum]
MNQTLLIADLHLSETRPDITHCFLQFLQQIDTGNTDALYILGDLFEVWIGDDESNAFTRSIANALLTLKDSGVPVYFIHGNRDFLLGKKYAEQSGMILLPQQQVIDLYGTATLILHGDELCTKDLAYQKFRRKARGWWWPRLVLALPLKTRRNIARKGRETSKQNQQQLTQDIMDVTPEEVLSYLARFNVSHMIHGHTHRPAIHHISTTIGTPAKRIVLGDWYEQGSLLKVTAESTELLSIPFGT